MISTLKDRARKHLEKLVSELEEMGHESHEVDKEWKHGEVRHAHVSCMTHDESGWDIACKEMKERMQHLLDNKKIVVFVDEHDCAPFVKVVSKGKKGVIVVATIWPIPGDGNFSFYLTAQWCDHE